MKKLAKDLTEQEKWEFYEEFYWVADVDDRDESGMYDGTTWGMVWHMYPDRILEGDSIKEMARNYWEQDKDAFRECFARCIAEEEKYRDG